MIWRIALTLLALPGLVGGGLLSSAAMTSPGTCPSIGPIPACFLVLAGYAVILASVWAPPKPSGLLFIAVFMPVLALAATGVVLELTQGDVCPKASGVPQCFYSLALAFLSLIAFLVLRRRTRSGDIPALSVADTV